MVEESLVAPGRLPQALRDEGRNVVAQLESMGVQVSAAFWQYLEEREAWQLCVATPLTDSDGPLHVYSLLQAALRAMTVEETGDLELSDIAVISPNARAVADLRRQYGAVDHEDSRRVRRVDGPYIYRLTAA
jgi:hypothetical protein